MKHLLIVVLLATATLAAPGQDVEGTKSLRRLKRQCVSYPDGRQECAKETCLSDPVPPQNAKLSCVIGRCNLKCADGYGFSNGASKITLYCQEKQWVQENSQAQTALPECVRKT